MDILEEEAVPCDEISLLVAVDGNGMPLLADNHLKVLESRFVRAGHFDTPLLEEDDNAKEILFVLEQV